MARQASQSSAQYNSPKGFTLIELLVVLAILAVLTGIAAPALLSAIDRSKTLADRASIRMLDNATTAYVVTEQVMTSDAFAGLTEDSQRLHALMDAKAIKAAPQPRQAGASFRWDVDTQSWYSGLYQTAEDTGSSYSFPNLVPADFLRTGNWAVSESGFCSSYGLLFIPNPRNEYTIQTQARLAAGTNGGYGILFDTVVAVGNQDTGYVLQFDRAYSDGALIVRPRTGGVEQSPVLRLTDRSKVPSRLIDPDWWTAEHAITLRVARGPTEGKISVAAWLDGALMFENLHLDAVASPATNHTGFRAWGTSSCLRTMQIQ